MKIVVDIQGAQAESRYRGIGVYSMALAEAIARNKGSHEVIIVANGIFHDTLPLLRCRFSRYISGTNFKVWHAPPPITFRHRQNDQRRFCAEILREYFIEMLEPDVILTTSMFDGMISNAATSHHLSSQALRAVILYDLIPLIYKDIYLNDSLQQHWYYEKLNHIRNADYLLAISDSSQQEALDLLNWQPNHICSISSAVNDQFTPLTISTEQKISLCKKFRIRKPFIMYTGGNDHRKNINRLVEAFANLPTPTRKAYEVVVAGNLPITQINTLRSLAKRNNVANSMVFTGYIDDADLVMLYNLCSLFVFPSIHEGFGLPILEAMKCEKPVIASNISSAREIIQLQRALFEPTNVSSISNKIEEALTSREFREALIGNAIARHPLFSWDLSAQKAIAALERAQKQYEPTEPSKTLRDLLKVPAQSINKADTISLADCIAKSGLKLDHTT